MTANEVGVLIEAISEDFTTDELSDDDLMLDELESLLGLEKPLLSALLSGAREIRCLRGNVRPLWAQYLQVQ